LATETKLSRSFAARSDSPSGYFLENDANKARRFLSLFAIRYTLLRDHTQHFFDGRLTMRGFEDVIPTHYEHPLLANLKVGLLSRKPHIMLIV
jgi:hypothetical protein